MPALLLSALLALSPALGGAQEPPRVRVIATGGTIASRQGAEQLTGDALVEAVPGLGQVARIEVEEFSRIGSSAMTPDHWRRLSLRIHEIYRADPGLAGIVVTHGTDSMEETAFFLHLTVTDPRPVVLTGSMRSATAVSADGPANLLAAVRVASESRSSGRGVLVVLNDVVHGARDVRKTDNNRVQTFVSREWGALGVVDLDGVVYRRAPEPRPLGALGQHLADVDILPLVPIVADFAGTDGSAVRSWVNRGASGLVVQAFGGGRTSPGMTAALQEAALAGVVVVRASRVAEGRVLPDAAQVADGVLTADDLPPHKARVLLMLALTENRTPAEIQALFGGR
jgi:L-asparaginase